MKRVTLLMVLFAVFLFPCVSFGTLIEVITTGTINYVDPYNTGQSDPFAWDGQNITTTTAFDDEYYYQSEQNINFYDPQSYEPNNVIIGGNSISVHGIYLQDSKIQAPFYFYQRFEGTVQALTGDSYEHYISMKMEYAFNAPYPSVRFEGDILLYNADYRDEIFYSISLNTFNFTPINNSEPVPEPATIFLLGAGVVGFVRYSGKRSKQGSVKSSKH